MDNYKRLNFTDREEISRGLAAGWTFSHIAHNIGRPVSTVTREVHGNCKYKRTYRAETAQAKSETFRRQQKQPKKMEVNPKLLEYVLQKILFKKWSPETIANRLKVDYASDMSMQISHESIYTYIYCLPRGSLRKELIKSLRHERTLRHNRKLPHSRRGAIQDAVSIHERPSETESRTIPGHWEGDLIMGSKASNSAMGTLVERTTRYTLLVPLKSHDALTVRTEFAKAVKVIPRRLKKSLTYGRGSEMASHKLFTKDTKIQVYFCDPHSPWQRGTNENTNGLLRQFFPKGCDFNTITKKEIMHVQDLLNDRPRKVLGYAKPDEVFLPLLNS
jgi:transposase, IS30 family